MWLETIVKVMLWVVLFGVFWNYFNNLFYYFFYSIKFVYSWFDLVFRILWTSDFSLYALYYVLIFWVVMLLINLIFKFIK